MTRIPFFPAIEPYRSGRLRVDPIHELYWEECGAPHGLPVVFLHGGPGAGASPAHRRFFDPKRYRIVIFDQRGAGRSTPLGETTGNDTPSLVSDIEQLRVHLAIDRWFVFGGSWGSTLGPGLCRGPRRAHTGPVPARNLPDAAQRDRVVSLWDEGCFSGSLGTLRFVSAGQRAERPAGIL